MFGGINLELGQTMQKSTYLGDLSAPVSSVGKVD